MKEQNRLVPTAWADATTNMMHKLKAYTTQLQNAVAVDGQQRPLALVDTGKLLSTGLVVPLEQLLENPQPELYQPISYMEGLPTIYGVPIWEKLEGESLEYYELFKRYRMLYDDKGLRSVYKLHIETGLPMQQLQLLRQNYFWQVRASAYDVYRKQEREYTLQVQRDEVQGKHRKTANKLFDICTDYVMNNAQVLTPKTALEWAKMAVELERISVGLQPDKPGMIATRGPQSVVNIQNNSVGSTTDHGTAATGDLSEDRTRLKQLINVMGNIGLFEGQRDDDTVVEAEEVEEI